MRVVWLAVVVAGVGCGPDARYSRDCVEDADCGLARLDNCSTRTTHSFRIEDARAAQAEHDALQFCPLGVTRVDGAIERAACVDSLCTLVLDNE